jgi:hypothetical protein
VKTRIEIDPNVRVRGQLTFAGFEDVYGPLRLGQTVEVYEPESNLVGEGRVVEIDIARQLVILGVDWASLRPEAGGPPVSGHLYRADRYTTYWVTNENDYDEFFVTMNFDVFLERVSDAAANPSEVESQASLHQAGRQEGHPRVLVSTR